MTGTDPATGALAGGTVQEQTRQAIANCLVILEAGGATDQVFATDPPARYVAKLGVGLPGVLVSIRMTAITS